MAGALSMVFDILAIDRASDVFKRVGDAAETSGAKAETGMAKIGSATTKVATGLGLAAAAATAYSVHLAGDFQQATNVLVTAAGESQSSLAMVRQGILDIAQATGTRWQDLTDGMYQIEKAGYRGADGLKILKAAAEGAREEGANLATVTAATTSVMASYHLGANAAVGVTNQIKTAAGEAKTTMEMFAGSLSAVLPLASANKISFADVAGSLASLTQHGTSADEAAQELAFTIRNLAAPNEVAVNAMNQLGISSVDVAQKLGDGPGGRGLAGTLNYLSQTVLEHMGPSGLVLLDTFKKSSSAAADMQTMLQSMPPKVQELSQKFADGSITLGDYRKAYKALPADQAALAAQFVAVANKANGFNDALKHGGPAAETYSQAMKQMTGGANGLNTVLQLTGESMAGTNERIARIAAAAAGAGDDVQGWASTQKLFNVQMDRFGQSLQAAAITLGTALLPVLSESFGFLSEHQTLVTSLVAGIGALTAGVLLYVAAQKTAAAWTSITNTALVTLIARKVSDAAATVALTAAYSENAVAAKVGAVAIGGMANAMSALKYAGAAGAVWVGLKVAINQMTQAMTQAGPPVERLTKDLLDAVAANAVQGLSQDLSKLGAALDGLDRNDHASGFFKFIDQINPLDQGPLDSMKNQIESVDKALAGLVSSGHAELAAQGLDKIRVAQHLTAGQMAELTKLLPEYNAALLHQSNAADLDRQSTDSLKGAQESLKGAQDSLNQALQTSIDKFTILNTGALSQERANEQLQTTTDALASSVKEHGKSLDLNTASGVANRTALLDLLQASNDKITADFKATQSTQGVQAAMDQASGAISTTRQNLLNQAAAAGLSKDAARTLIDQILLTPAQVQTQFNTPGLAAAQQNVDSLRADLNALPSLTSLQIQVGINRVGMGISGNNARMADGGYVSGPGGPRDDAIPAWLSDGEFVVNAAATSRHLPMLKAINNHYADGGQVGSSPVIAGSGAPQTVILRVGDREFTAYVDERAMSAVKVGAQTSSAGGWV